MSTYLKKQACGHVTINAAFLQEVKEAYSELWQKVHTMKSAAQNGLPLSVELNQWVVHLTELRSQLATEFSLEETYGYVTRAARPFSSTTVDPALTRGQHAELYLQLSEICEQVEEAQYRGTIMRDFAVFANSFSAFVNSLLEHERFEARLIELGMGVASNNA